MSMKIGSKSLLFGAHCWFIHPFFVALAWWKLYGFPRDYRLWIAFLVHDWGYWGCEDMDGESGKDHPYLGAKLMGFWFDPWGDFETYPLRWPPYFASRRECLHMRVDSFWYDFCLLHSRHVAQRLDKAPSMLCMADKLAMALEPWWLYIPRVVLTGEVHEYLELARVGLGKDYRGRLIEWKRDVSAHLRNYVKGQA